MSLGGGRRIRTGPWPLDADDTIAALTIEDDIIAATSRTEFSSLVKTITADFFLTYNCSTFSAFPLSLYFWNRGTIIGLSTVIIAHISSCIHLCVWHGG
ncbi:hypothetical protein BDZ45DRAFT_355122 [Acephala macrosclerotiorum]|nr:hypothetical protein BDZ45DRAFT_355122 [Acephala macrosclerotiorum]